jgi:hypothetical protein
MKNLAAPRRVILFIVLVLGIFFVRPNPGLAVARGKSAAPASTGFPCKSDPLPQNPARPDLPSPAQQALCRLYADVADEARSLFSGNAGSQYLPWAPMLVALVVICFLAVAALSARKMKDYRPRRKYKIGRTI